MGIKERDKRFGVTAVEKGFITLDQLFDAMKGAGDDLDVVLRGNAVNYAIDGQDASGLSFGGRTQTHPPDLVGDLKGLLGKGVKVYVVSCDARERGIEDQLIDGVETVERSGLGKLMGDYERVWSW